MWYPYFWKHPPWALEDLEATVAPLLDPKAGRKLTNWFYRCFVSTRKESNSTYKYNTYIYICTVELTSARLQEKKRLKVVYTWLYAYIRLTYIHTHTHIVWSLSFAQHGLQPRSNSRGWTCADERLKHRRSPEVNLWLAILARWLRRLRCRFTVQRPVGASLPNTISYHIFLLILCAKLFV